ncbi:MAG: hypothetical protein V1699_05635 [Candidatus Omnitrophota bacterium]
MQEKDLPAEERRKYIRINSVFPVQFKLSSLGAKCFLTDWQQGFTNNIGRGGLCLEVNNLKPELVQAIKSKAVKFSLAVDLLLSNSPMNITAAPSWIKEAGAHPDKYLIGLNYENISPGQNNQLMRLALTKKYFAPAALSIIIILIIFFAMGSYLNIKLTKGNKALVEQLVAVVQESNTAKRQIKQISKDKEDLGIKIQALSIQLKNLGEEKLKFKESAQALEEKSSQRIKELNELVAKITQDKTTVQKNLAFLQNKENTATEGLLRLKQKKAALEKANLDKMYQWLKVHQNPRTGLVMSFEGDNDIADWAFTYDQALVLMAYANFSDFGRAKKILDFFQTKAEKVKGQFINAYYAGDGKPAEFIVHSGPNIWLGIAIVHYTKTSLDRSYLKLAEEIAQGIINLQAQDIDGGVRGGPDVRWYATEHNLDAYAFFNMLYLVTQKEQYLKARDKVLSWLTANTYNKFDIPINRGKGDSTIATDTYAWSIAAIGPQQLEELGMNPDSILEFAEKNCSVEVDFTRPEGKTVKVKGFDFAPQRHVSRGGVVSSEWTAQMVLSFKIMAEYYYKKGMIAKARTYEFKADDYLNCLGNMVISSPSPSGQGESCLPYATEDFVDTGHGWMTPKGKSTGSVSGTAYTIFAYYKFNPLELQ